MKEIKSTLSWDKLFMQHVYLIATKSKDPRTKIGAVLVRDGIVISEGYNGFPRGVKDYVHRYTSKELKYQFVAHAEANSVLNAARNGISTRSATCYTQGIPCNECAKTLIQGGISEIVVHKQWPGMLNKWVESAKITKAMCKEAGVKIRTLSTKIGMTGYSNDNVFSI